MKIITTTGFYGTGSSAITDILSEYKNITCKGDFEVRIAHDPYGISDLEYNIIENPNRHNSSNAIKKFIKLKKRLANPNFARQYENYFNNMFTKITDEYIGNLYEFSYKGQWHYDLIERGDIFYFTSRLYNKILRILKKFIGICNDVNHNFLPKNELAYLTISDEKIFLSSTIKFFDKLFSQLNDSDDAIVMIDQLVPPSNIARYERYFSNISTIVVERDPRDIYLLEKIFWKGKVVPHYDVEIFCKWYEWTRNQYESSNKGKSIKIQFEDLIYNYNGTVKKIENYLDIDSTEHTMSFKKFDPKISIKNTQLWKQYPQYNDNIQYIQNRLAKYCYNFEK